ncbi:hypothetical protein DFR66_1157 [Flavobacterium glaciei]|uniref:Uncharacterized protein n=1 Tax=Flavobacterium glaciei TaxID=386300 RepID=A0ABX9HUZ0_9FLAO|nr:hypothetical protein DFR66_1157 [Flavobacterium glaciei]
MLLILKMPDTKSIWHFFKEYLDTYVFVKKHAI